MGSVRYHRPAQAGNGYLGTHRGLGVTRGITFHRRTLAIAGVSLPIFRASATSRDYNGGATPSGWTFIDGGGANNSGESFFRRTAIAGDAGSPVSGLSGLIVPAATQVGDYLLLLTSVLLPPSTPTQSNILLVYSPATTGAFLSSGGAGTNSVAPGITLSQPSLVLSGFGCSTRHSINDGTSITVTPPGPLVRVNMGSLTDCSAAVSEQVFLSAATTSSITAPITPSNGFDLWGATTLAIH